jgi:hypothetical protein
MKILKKIPRNLIIWVGLTSVSVIFLLTAYLAVQQNYRLTANDPQIQIAEDTAKELANSQKNQLEVSPNKTDISRSLSVFIIVYDDKGQVVTSSAILDGKNPELPIGVLYYARDHGRNLFTWQPKPGVRIAAAVAKFSGKQSGYVLVGRSLREVEVRIDKLTSIFGISLAAIIILESLTVILLKNRKK